MAIDTSIYNNLGRGVTNSLEVLQSMQAADRGRQVNQLGALQLQDAQDQRDQRDRLRSILARMNPQGNAADQAAELQRGGFLKEGRDLLQADALAQKTQREGDRAAIETAGKRAELAGQLMSGAKDQASYDAVRQQLTGVMGADAVAQMPAQFDPQFAQRVIQQSMGTVEQAKQNLQALQQQETGRHNLAAEGETGRHNLQAEAVARGQLGVAQGQLGVARQNAGLRGAELGLSRDRLALDKANGGVKAPSGYMADPTNPGRLVAIPGGPADESVKPMTDAQAKALLFGNRAKESAGILDQMAAQGVVMPSQTKRFAESIPGIGGALGALANATVASPKQQQVEQGQRDIINALLRRESGAVIAKPEYQNADQQYFPQIGDSQAVIKQKRENLRTAINGILAEVPQSRRPAALAGTGAAMQGIPGSAPGSGAPARGADDPLGLRGGR